MEIPMTPQETADKTQSASSIKNQYNQGPSATNTMPTPQELEERRKKQEEWLDANLPFLKKQEEYNRIKIALIESEVLLGETSVNQVQGLLGLELKVRELQANGFLTQWVAGQKAAMENAKREKEMAAKIPTEQDMIDAEKKAKEVWDTLSPEEQQVMTADMEVEMTDKGIGEAYSALNEAQKINVIMAKKALKENAQ